jgi:hypothetical protein
LRREGNAPFSQRIHCTWPCLDDIYDGVVADRRRQPKTMNDDLRAEVIIGLRRRGFTYKQIGQRVGLSANGVKYALHRVTQPGRYDEYYEEEVDYAPGPEAW